MSTGAGRPDGDPSRSRAFGAAFVGLAVLSLVPIWGVIYPPMVDLPQDAAQIRLWMDFDRLDPDRYQLNYWNPYLAFHVLGRTLAAFLPIVVAMKVLASLALLATPAWMAFELRRRRVDPWLALLGFPTAFSLCFYWGLINFMLAAPLACWWISGALRPEPPDSLRLAGRTAVGLVLFFTHGLVCGFAVGVVGALALLRGTGWRDRALRALPTVAPVLLAGVWLLGMRDDAQTSHPPSWNWSFERLASLPAELLGARTDPTASIAGLAILGITAWVLASRPAEPLRWLPVGAVLGVYLLGPEIYFTAAFLNARFLAVLLPAAALGVARPSTPRILRLAAVAVAATWLAVVALRALRTDRDNHDLEEVFASLEPGHRLVGLIADPVPPGIDFPVFLHSHAWYTARTGDVADFSFAWFYPQVVRYREGVRTVPDGSVWHPDRFDPRGAPYDRVLVRTDGSFRIPAGLELLARSGSWSLWANPLADLPDQGG